jgi:hypothetical protein
MLHSLLTEIVRRRLWPIPVIAVAVAVGAPLLFLKSEPVGAPSVVAAAPAVPAEGSLPARAQRLLASNDSDAAPSRHGPARSPHDPFSPPKGHRATATPDAGAAGAPAAAKTSSSSSSKTADGPVPVVITNADGSAPKTHSTPAPAASGDTAPAPMTVSSAAVDVRFGKQIDARVRREIPRLQTFVARGNIVAVFVKYSPNRHKAVFAISPSTLVTGDVECRRKAGLCRYVDLAAGKHARLSWRMPDGTVVSRRLDVVRIDRAVASGPNANAAAQASSASANGSCLLGKLLRLGADGRPVSRDACPS